MYFSCERRLQDRDFGSRKGRNGGRKSFAFSWAFFFYVFLVIRADVVSIQPLLSFVLLFILFLLCRFDFPSPLLFPLAIHYPGPFFSFFLSYSFFDLVHYHNWPFLFWHVRSGGSRPFYFFSSFLLLLLSCVVLFGGIIRFILYIMRKCGQSRPMIWFLRHLKEV